MSNQATAIEIAMIRQDASFMVGLFMALRQLDEKDQIPFILSCIDFYSLVIYEASRFYLRTNPEASERFQTDFAEIIKQSRQRMKLFDDKEMGVDGIGDMFINILTPQHQRELSKDHPFPLPKWMWTDIGMYLDETSGIPVGTTHLASFNSGVTNPNDFFSGEVSHGLGQSLGRFLRLFADATTLVRISGISIIAKDMRYSQIYSSQHYGSENEQVNAGLSVIDMRMNFLSLLVSRCSPSPTIFKWKFLSIYHAISSLSTFSESEQYKVLDLKQKAAIEHTLQSPIAALMRSEDAIPLRNTLTHYGIDTRIDQSKLHNKAQEFFGLVEACLPGWSYKALHDFIDDQLKTELLDMFGIWKSAR